MKIRKRKQPIPKVGRKSVFPLNELRVDESLFVESDNPDHTAKRLRMAAAYIQRKSRKRFSTHKVLGGAEIWRIK